MAYNNSITFNLLHKHATEWLHNINPMKVLFLDTMHLSNEVLKTFILTVSAFKDIKCDLSPFDIDATRKRLPLLCTIMGQHKIDITILADYDGLASLGKEGKTLVSVDSLEDYASKLANEFKYY